MLEAGAPLDVASHQFRQTKIRHLHPSAAVEQDVLRLDVAMDDALVVRELERVANLRHDGQRLARRDASGVEQLSQVHAVHEFHQEVVKRLRAEGRLAIYRS